MLGRCNLPRSNQVTAYGDRRKSNWLIQLNGTLVTVLIDPGGGAARETSFNLKRALETTTKADLIDSTRFF